MAIRSQTTQNSIQRDCHWPASSVDDLAFKLELDLLLGHRQKFRRRLQRALRRACEQGKPVN